MFLTILSCAQIVAPTGGKPDKTPPMLINSIPINKTKNFNGRELEFTFNELIDASTINSELFIVPTPPGIFDYKIKNNVLKLKFDKPFSDNTTYTFNFRNSVKDLTERNPAKNLKLVISTGNEIDSLQLQGTIKNIFTKEPVLDATIALFPFDTLDMQKRKPLYFVKTDSSGKYLIENIKANKYFFLAFTDKNNNLRFDQKEEQISFLKDSLVINKNINLNELELYPANFIHNKIKKTINRESENVLTLEKDPLKVNIKFENENDSSKVSYIWNKNMLYIHKLVDNQIDTIKTEIIVTDSLLTNDTLSHKIFFPEGRGKKRKLEPINLFIDKTNGEEMTTKVTYNLRFDKPITYFEKEKILFKTDTLITEKLKVETHNKYEIKLSIDTKAKNEVELIIPSNTIHNNLGDTNNIIQLKNKILNKENTAIIHGNVKNKTTNKIAILQNDSRSKEYSRIKFLDKFTFENVIPGTYHITIIFDDNLNGIWDPGNLQNLTLPEKILTTQEPIRMRANFERIIEINE